MLFLRAAALLLLAPVAFGASPPSEGGDGHGLSVRLELPWTTLLFGERIRYVFVLENAADKAVPIAVPGVRSMKEVSYGWPGGGQPFIEGKWRNGNRPDPGYVFDGGPLAVDKAVWPPRDGFGTEMRAWLSLPPGQRICWNQNRLPDLYFGISSTMALEGIQAHWLVGPDRWISSKTVQVEVVNVPAARLKRVFDANWSSNGLGKDRCSGAAYTIPIEGNLFLFMDGVRLAEVGSEDRFEHQIDKDCTNMEITITGPAGSRKVYYHLRHGITRDTPWPIGPVSLFYPKPEPIPPAELAELRKAAAEKTAPVGTKMREPEGSSGAGTSPRNVPPDALNEPKRWWPWVAVGLVLVVGLVIGRIIRLRRGSHRSFP